MAFFVSPAFRSAAFTKQSLFWFGNSLRQPLFYISIGEAGNPFRDIQSKRPKPWQGQNTNFENVIRIQLFFVCDMTSVTYLKKLPFFTIIADNSYHYCIHLIGN